MISVGLQSRSFMVFNPGFWWSPARSDKCRLTIQNFLWHLPLPRGIFDYNPWGCLNVNLPISINGILVNSRGFLVNQNSNMQLLHSFSSGSFLANERKTRSESITLPSKRGVPSTYIGYVNIWWMLLRGG